MHPVLFATLLVALILAGVAAGSLAPTGRHGVPGISDAALASSDFEMVPVSAVGERPGYSPDGRPEPAGFASPLQTRWIARPQRS